VELSVTLLPENGLTTSFIVALKAFFPKNRGNWKNFSSWEPEEKSKREKKTIEDTRFPPDVEVKKGYSWSDQLGIAVANLVEGGQKELVNWTQDVSLSCSSHPRCNV